MNRQISDLNIQEKAIFDLRALYRSYGYAQFKMSKFEEYDLYVRNKDFLLSDSIITFTDTNGKLLALKPDVTLSIIKNSKDAPGTVQKMYYNENVYRVSSGTHSFREIPQVGLECIGDVDLYCVFEVLTLAAESLRCISSDSLLNISHLGILTSALADLPLSAEKTRAILRCVGEKNAHELRSQCEAAGVEKDRIDLLCALLSTYGAPHEVLNSLEALPAPSAAFTNALGELRSLTAFLSSHPLYPMLRIDFSVTGDIRYYNGITFCGFVGGIPQSILSGGQYDRLMQRMNRSSRAIGFAVYLDLLERLPSQEEIYDADCLLLYDEGCNISCLAAARAELSKDGASVTVQRAIPEKGRYKKIYRLSGSEVTEL